MGIVYEAFDRERNSHVALKMVRQLTSDALQRFKNEFRSVQDLHHPNLVRLDQLLEVDGELFFTMELVDGVNFLRWVRRVDPGADSDRTERDHEPSDGPTRPDDDASPSPPVHASGGAPAGRSFDEARLRSVLVQLAHGLCALHAAGKVHRDIKPSNLLVTPEGRLVILDFGLVADAFGRGDAGGQITGTLSFMAPEQAASEAIGTDADWYAVGVVLYLALTGRPPFAGTPLEVLSFKQERDPPPPSQLVAGIPPDLDILCRELLRRRPSDRPRGAEVLRRLGVAAAAGPEPAVRSFFVGRSTELQRLGECFGRAARGSATTVLVTGESGIGKSALLRRFVDDLDPTQTLVLSGRCYERESTPFKAFDEVMSALARVLVRQSRDELVELLPEHIELVAGTFPALRPVTALLSDGAGRGGRSHDPFQSRMLAFATLHELFGRLRRRHMVVIAIDDLQWADGDSLALLSYLLRPPSAPPLLVCATMRKTESEPPRISALRGHIGENLVDLLVEPLPHTDACELAAHLVAVSGEPGAAIQSAAVAEVAGGHPMFIDALVRHRLRHPKLDEPLRLDDAILERTAALEPDAARLLGFVCAAGGPIAQEVCAHAAGLLFGDFTRVTSALRAAHLVKTRGVERQDVVEPYHDRVREAVIAHLAPEVRSQIHACLAVALESGGRAEPETLSYHFWHGGDVSRAADYAVLAAEQAAEALAFAQSARWYRFALEHATGPAARTWALMRSLALALANSEHGREAGELYLQLADHAIGDERVDLLRHAADQLLVSGHVDEGMLAIGAVLKSVGMKLPPTPRAALASLAYQRARLGLRGSLLRYRRREAADVSPGALTRIDACWSVGVGLAIIDPIRAADFQARHLRLSLAAGEPYRIACALAAEAGFAAAAGGRAQRRVARLVRAAEKLAEEVGHPNALGYAAFAAGAADYFVGRWRPSRETFDRAAVIFRDRCVGVAWWHQTVQYVALECLWYEGAIAELCRRVPQLRRTAEARSDLYGIANLGIGLPNATALVVDDVDGARRLLATAMSGWSQRAFHVQHLGQLLGQVQADLYVGDGEQAYRRVSEAWPHIRDALLMRVQLSRITTHHQRARSALGAAAARSSDVGARRRLVAEARRDARRIERERMAWADPLAALVRAGAARLDGDDEAALVALQAAVDGFDASGMGLYAAVARWRLGEHLGASEGSALVEGARAWMRAAGLRRPERMAAALAPGF